MNPNLNLVVTDQVVMCDECKREDHEIALIANGQNFFCLKCAADLNIIDEGDFNEIKDYGELQGGRIEQAIQKALNKEN